MKYIKKILGILLAVAFVITLSMSDKIVAEASKTYTIAISLGNEEHASFNTGELSGYSTEVKYRTSSNGDKIPYKLVISGLSYSAEVPIDVKSLVELDGSKYCVKGLRVSGGDALVTGGTSVKLTVEKDETYVVAYGVDSVVPYIVQYVDTDGNTLYADDKLYDAAGEEAVVPARHIEGYTPDEVEKTLTVAEGAAVKFVYTSLPATVVYETVEETSVVYVKGEPTYTYEYEYLEANPTVTTKTNTTNTVVNNRKTNGTTVTEGADADTSQTGGTDNTTVNTAEGTGITGEDTSGEVLEIADEDTPLSGDVSDGFTRNMKISIFIAIVALIAAIVAVIVTYLKRREIVSSVRDDSKR